jgi:hypothetical protein
MSRLRDLKGDSLESHDFRTDCPAELVVVRGELVPGTFSRMERARRGNLHAARQGSVNAL